MKICVRCSDFWLTLQQEELMRSHTICFNVGTHGIQISVCLILQILSVLKNGDVWELAALCAHPGACFFLSVLKMGLFVSTWNFFFLIFFCYFEYCDLCVVFRQERRTPTVQTWLLCCSTHTYTKKWHKMAHKQTLEKIISFSTSARFIYHPDTICKKNNNIIIISCGLLQNPTTLSSG